MPLTSLFPADHTPVTIQQGNTGDCYILASLDCILNSSSDGRRLIKSMFYQDESGVTLRIKRTELFNTAKHLVPGHYQGKFAHRYDAATNEDVFFFNNERLRSIDSSFDGVHTNSLAVKIIERISSYYYTGNWPTESEGAMSIGMHNAAQRYPDTVSPTGFIGKLLGIDAHDTTSVNKIIKVKQIDPHFPVYISIDFNEPGKPHAYHALRLDTITPAVGGSYQFTLVNPWDNQGKKLTYSLEQITARNPRYSMFNTNKTDFDLMTVLLACPLDEGAYVNQHPTLKTLLLNMQKVPLTLTPGVITAAVRLHKNIPYLDALYSKCPPEQQSIFLACIVAAGGNSETFIASLIKQAPLYELIQIIYRRERQMGFPAIATLLSETIATNKHSVLATALNRTNFFQQVIDAAIVEKKKAMQWTNLHAYNYVEDCLILYYFQPEISTRLTSSGGLRILFNNKILSLELIGNRYGDAFLWAAAVGFYRKEHREFSSMESRLATMDAALVDANFLQILISKGGFTNNPNEFFKRMYDLHLINPKAAEQLMKQAALTAPIHFNKTWDVCCAEMAAPQNSGAFNEWFSLMHRPLDEASAREIVTTYSQQINALEVSFAACFNDADIAAQTKRLQQSIDALCANFALTAALRILGTTEFNNVVSHKQQAITKAAQDKAKELHSAQQIVAHYVAVIRDFDCSFPALKESEINSHASTLAARLNELTYNKPDLNNALQHLGLINSSPIQIALNKKRQELSLNRQQLHYAFQDARSTIASAVHRVNTLRIQERFYQINSEGEVDALVATLNAELEQIKQAPVLLKAQNFLDFKETTSPIIQAIAKQQEVISSSAQLTRHELRKKRALEVVNHYVQHINAFQVDFSNLTTSAHIATRTTALHRSLEAIISNKPELNLALNQLGFNGRVHPLLDRAQTQKKQQINVAARQQQERIANAERTIDDYASQIRNFFFTFHNIKTITAVEHHTHLLVTQLDAMTKNKPDLDKAYDFCSLPNNKVKDAREGIIAAIHKEAACTRERIIKDARAESQALLQQINFTGNLGKIAAMKSRLEKEFKKHPNYKDAVREANTLYTRLQKAESNFLTSLDPAPVKIAQFQKACDDAIKPALEVLKEHRGWKQVLADLASAVLSILSLGTANLATGRFRLFTPMTRSEEETREFAETINKMKPSGS